MKSLWLEGAGEDGRELGVEGCDLGVLKVCDTNPRPLPRPRVLGGEGPFVKAEAPRPTLCQAVASRVIWASGLVLTSSRRDCGIVRTSSDCACTQFL